MATIKTSVDAQSKALSDAAAEILAQPKVPERRFVPLSAADAVLRYASDFIPSSSAQSVQRKTGRMCRASSTSPITPPHIVKSLVRSE